MLHDGDAPIVQLISSTFVRRQCSDKLAGSHDSRASVKSGQEAPGGYKLPGAFFLWMAQLQRSGLQHHVDHAKNVRPLSAYCRSNRGEPSFEKNTNQYFRIALVPPKKLQLTSPVIHAHQAMVVSPWWLAYVLIMFIWNIKFI